MSFDQAATLVDQLIYEFNGEHLNDLERSIVEGVSEGKKYGEIAEELGCTSGHVTDAAAKLWQALSQALGEKVSKKNIKAVIERHKSSATVSDGFVQISSVNVCSDITINTQTQRDPKSEKVDRTPQKYLLDAPALLPFYGRTTELTPLQTYIENHSRLILIHAPSGTGKTALARQLIEQNPQYDTIIWQSLQCHRPLTEFLDRNITPNFSRILTSPSASTTS